MFYPKFLDLVILDRCHSPNSKNASIKLICYTEGLHNVDIRLITFLCLFLVYGNGKMTI